MSSKDHITSSNATIDAYIIGITTGEIGDFGRVETRINSVDTQSDTGFAAVGMLADDEGWATTGVGGQATTESGGGRMLMGIRMTEDNGVEVTSKDHVRVSRGRTHAHLIEIRKK